jgi:hypothetical protein
MADKSLVKWVFLTFVVVIFAGLFSTVVCLAAEDSDSENVAASGGNGLTELQMRVESSITEINDSTRAAKEQAKAEKRQLYFEDNHEWPIGEVLSKEDLDKFERMRTEKEEAVRDRAEYDIKYLEEQKAAAPQISGIELKETTRPRPVMPGTVTGVVFYEGKGAALVLGDIVRESDVISGIKVIRIVPGSVEFEKQGRKWKQEVGQEPPLGLWEQKDKAGAPKQSSAGKKTEPTQR